MKKNSLTLRSSGFTLIEMLVTITIIIILAGLSLGGYKFVSLKQSNSQAQIQIKLLSSGLEEYKLDNGVYPGVETGQSSTNSLYKALYYNGAQTPPVNDSKIYISDLDPNNNKQGWTSGSGASVKLVDPWGKDYIYRIPGTVNPDFDLLSAGPDGKTNATLTHADNKDDIANY